jgi:hypothetical protein
MSGDGGGGGSFATTTIVASMCSFVSTTQKRKERKIGKKGERETKEEKFVVEAFRKKERGVPRPMSSSNFSRKRIGCNSNCNSSRSGYKSSF